MYIIFYHDSWSHHCFNLRQRPLHINAIILKQYHLAQHAKFHKKKKNNDLRPKYLKKKIMIEISLKELEIECC